MHHHPPDEFRLGHPLNFDYDNALRLDLDLSEDALFAIMRRSGFCGEYRIVFRFARRPLRVFLIGEGAGKLALELWIRFSGERRSC